MRPATKVAALVGALATAAILGALATSGFGGDGAGSLGPKRELVGPVPLVSAHATTDASRGLGSANATTSAKQKKPQITQLITTDPLTVPADGELVAVLKCPKKQRPVTGGAITPPAPADVLINVLSRFNPNTLAAPGRSFYVGVRNQEAEPQQWLATVTCMKNVKET